jgi:serine/threonine protein kinase
MPGKRRSLHLPRKVSVSAATRKVQRSGGTSAFVSHEKWLEKIPVADRRKRLREMAHGAEFFVKPHSARAEAIRKRLNAAGIRTEIPIQNLKNGTSLFRKDGHPLLSEEGKKIFAQNPAAWVGRIERLVAAVHSLGISHNHFHVGNLLVTEKREIVLIDLGLARHSPIPKTYQKGWAVKRFKNDLLTIGREVNICYSQNEHIEDHLRGMAAYSLKPTSVAAVIMDYYAPELKKQLPLEDQIQITG